MYYTYIMMLPVTVVLYWIISFLRLPKEKVRLNSVFIAFLGMMLICDFYTSHIIGHQPVGRMIYILDYADCFLMPALAPLFFIHLKRLAVNNTITWKDGLWFIPSLFLGFGNLIFGMQVGFSEEVTNRMGEGFEYSSIDISDFSVESLRWFFNATVYDVVMIGELVPIIIILYLYLRRYRSRLEDFYADLDEDSYGHMRDLLIWAMGLSVLAFILVSVNRWYIANHPWLAVIFMVAYAVVQCVVCYHAFRIEVSTKDLDEASKEADHPEEEITSSAETSDAQHDYSRVERALNAWTSREDKPYLAEGITLATVAKECHLSQRLISNYLNSVCKKHFNVWINEFRVEEAKRLLLSSENLTMIEIASRCGMADAATLTRIFKKHVGFTPSEFRHL